MTSTLGIISPGNMGSGVGKFLVDGGFRVIAPLKHRSDFTQSRAKAIGIEDVGSLEACIENADIVLSILDPAKALDVAKQVAIAMKKLGRSKPFVDCNATSPATAVKMSEIFKDAGGHFIDVGIIGGAPTRKENFPVFFASGPRAAMLDFLDGHGLRVIILGTEVGRGSAIKICNGAWNKGAFALYAAVMMAAERYGFTEVLRERLPNSQAGTVEKIDAALNRLPSLSERYVGEMEQVAETYSGIGIPAGFHEAAAETFRMLNTTSLGNERRETIDNDRNPLEVLAKLVAELDLREKNKS
ncbi:MAG: DUF1932 domain-containing protein [Rhodospirillaceae bacterium]